MLRILLLAALIAAGSLVASGVSQARDWEKLGEKRVGFIQDRDVIHVGRREGRFKRIKILVKDNDIQFEDLRVVYGNGDVDDLPVRDFIRAGGETRAIDLRGRERFIKEIHMRYRSRPDFRGQATVEVWGLQD